MQPLEDWISDLFRHPELLKMGHQQRAADLNLGLGWLYYGLARVQRCGLAVVIGSYRGFVPLVVARALKDNVEPGDVVFVDPSLVDDFWRDADSTRRYFASFGLENVRHFLHTTQDFIRTPSYGELHDIGLLLVDGYHTAEQARFDFEVFAGKLAADATVLFHDSVRTRRSRMYGEERVYEHTVVHYMDELKRREDLQVFDLPFDSGVTLVRRKSPSAGGWSV